MAVNAAKRDEMTKRREIVARLRLRGLSCREIAEALQKQQEFAAVSHVTVSTDIKALTAQWRAEALADTSELKGQQLAEMRMARRQAWQDKDTREIRALLSMEIDLTGTNAPVKVAPTDPSGTKPYDGNLTDAERMARIAALADTARTRGAGQPSPVDADADDPADPV